MRHPRKSEEDDGKISKEIEKTGSMKKRTIPIVPVFASLEQKRSSGIPSPEEVAAFIDREFIRKPLHREKVRYIAGYSSEPMEYPIYHPISGRLMRTEYKQVPIIEYEWRLSPHQEKKIIYKLLWFLGLEEWQVKLKIKLKEADPNSIDVNLLINEAGFDD